MSAGECEEGRRHYSEAFRVTGLWTEAQIKTVSLHTSYRYCPPVDGTPLEEARWIHAQLESYSILGLSPDRCHELAVKADALLAAGYEDGPDNYLRSGLQSAGVCLGKAERCEEARAAYESVTRLTLGPSATPEAFDRVLKSSLQRFRGCPIP